jgi:hypothetical protein
MNQSGPTTLDSIKGYHYQQTSLLCSGKANIDLIFILNQILFKIIIDKNFLERRNRLHMFPCIPYGKMIAHEKKFRRGQKVLIVKKQVMERTIFRIFYRHHVVLLINLTYSSNLKQYFIGFLY